MNQKRLAIIMIITVTVTLSLLFTVSCKRDWAAKVGDQVITIEQFNRYYYLQNKLLLNLEKADLDKLATDPSLENHPTINKNRFMDFLVSRILLFNKAKKDDGINQDDLNSIVELSTMNAVASYYLAEKFKDDITVSDEEANAFYEENKELFKGVPVDDNIVNRIKQQIFMQKLEKKSNEYIMDLIAEGGVNREGFRKYMKDEAKKSAEKVKTESPDTKIPEPDATKQKAEEPKAPAKQAPAPQK